MHTNTKKAQRKDQFLAGENSVPESHGKVKYRKVMLRVLQTFGTYRYICCQADDQGGSDSIRDGRVGILSFLSGGSNDVKTNESIETRGCSLQHLWG